MTSFILILLASIFFTGIVNRVKSITSGRKGPGILQPVKDVIRLFKKKPIYSKTTSFVFQVAPGIYFASVIMAIMIIPLGELKGIISFDGDFVFFAYILGIGKFFNIIGALDTGSSFEGMGASREALFSMFAEPAFFILMGSFALLTNHSSFQEIFTSMHFGSSITYVLGVLATIVLVMIALVENSRMPFDDPKTHLELTMVHEVMVLDNSGFDLGLISLATNLKFAMYGALIANLYMGNFPLYLTIPIFLGIQFMFAISVGILESFTARFRMNRNPQYILVLSSVSLLIFLGVLLVLGEFR
ncbi:respiratory chain complex I subunit 1 family protein [Flavihumibacter profundi]|jgi:formate hydrogenlyase subunit 4|uniref:respiratory chain complex I subunit 1 family protein n=1 Tax=Flavihumibacter profundi TaxID=2716883 RepID=UPI001CC7B57A|nr:NADH-quinone oxidoreductase subunit H [Flavihumibacter profundi]MBZ5857095.1 NADH-quinone oxidoreductase subunit H [Flavihumibacter profundi]